MMQGRGFFSELWQAAQRIAYAILGGVIPRLTPEDIQDRMSRRPLRDQVIIVASVLLALLFTSLLFANAGVIGMLVFFLLVILIVR